MERWWIEQVSKLSRINFWHPPTRRKPSGYTWTQFFTFSCSKLPRNMFQRKTFTTFLLLNFVNFSPRIGRIFHSHFSCSKLFHSLSAFPTRSLRLSRLFLASESKGQTEKSAREVFISFTSIVRVCKPFETSRAVVRRIFFSLSIKYFIGYNSPKWNPLLCVMWREKEKRK